MSDESRNGTTGSALLDLARSVAKVSAQPICRVADAREFDHADGRAVVAACRLWGFLIVGQSTYLAVRCLVQFATMGAITREDCTPFFQHLSSMFSTEGSNR